jgi:hypothetical protein
MSDSPEPSRRRDKVCVLVDNCGLFRALQGLGTPKLDYKRLKDFVVRQRDAVVVRYYTGEIRNEGTQRADFYSVLRRAGYDVITCCNERSAERHAANDMPIRAWCMSNIVWDMCDLCHTGNYDTFIVISGCVGLAKAVMRVQSRGVEVEVVFFEEECSEELKTTANKFRPLDLDAVAMKARKDGLTVTRQTPQEKLRMYA